jgi:Ala-tRNA(Pro) deacylase
MPEAFAWKGHMESARRRLFERFTLLGIKARTVPYPAHRTVEEGKALRGAMAGQFTKNLLLKDKKGRLFLIVANEDRVLDLKTLHTQIGASGRVGFAGTEQMRQALGIEPGALTPFALINDIERRVVPVIDATLLDAEQVNFHPLINTESTGVRPGELLAFVRDCGHEPLIVSFDSP